MTSASSGGGQPSAVAIATIGQDKLVIAKVDQRQAGLVTAASQDVRIVVEGTDAGGHKVEWCVCNKFTCGILG